MSAEAQIDKQIVSYLEMLNSKQKKAVLSVVKTFAEEEPSWSEKKFNSEMERRLSELESGKVKGLTLDQLEEGARKAYKNRKRKKFLYN